MTETWEEFITEVDLWCPVCIERSAHGWTFIALVDGVPDRAVSGTTCEGCGRVVGPDGVEVE
jgi:hypothetical protein